MLVVLPLLISFIERIIIGELAKIIGLEEPFIQFTKAFLSSILIISAILFFHKNYGLGFSSKNIKLIFSSTLFLSFSIILFLLTLNQRGLSDDLIYIHLINWILVVFREEVIVRGIIQTESKKIFKSYFAPIIFSTLIFSLWHLVNLTSWSMNIVLLQLLSAIPAGLIYGFIKEKTDSTILTFLLHISVDLIMYSLYLIVFGKLFFELF